MGGLEMRAREMERELWMEREREREQESKRESARWVQRERDLLQAREEAQQSIAALQANAQVRVFGCAYV